MFSCRPVSSLKPSWSPTSCGCGRQVSASVSVWSDIGERELAKILFGDEALLNQLKRFGYHLAEIRHIKVREVGAEHRPQPKAHPGIEGPQGRSVVGLATEVKVGGERHEPSGTGLSIDYLASSPANLSS